MESKVRDDHASHRYKKSVGGLVGTIMINMKTFSVGGVNDEAQDVYECSHRKAENFPFKPP